MTKTVVGFFERMLLAEDAIQQLQKAGVPRDCISLVANDAAGEYARNSGGDSAGVAAGAGAGAAMGGIAGLVLGLTALAIPGIGPLVAAGPLAAALGSIGVGAAAGGLLGALTKQEIPENDAHYYAEGVRRGGALVIIKTDADEADRVRDLLDYAGASDVEEHAAKWRADRWQHGPTETEVEADELSHSSQPQVPQLTRTAARIYSDGLEFDPRKSRFEDFISE